MHKFFTTIINNEIAYIQKEDIRHLKRVLRIKSGDKIQINDFKGNDFIGIVGDVDREDIKVDLIEKIKENNESKLNITLFQGFPKSSKMDLIVQKGTELGINTITPLITKRVVVRNAKEFKKKERLQKIALESSKQSKRSIIPVITDPIYIEELQNIYKNYDLIIVPYENKEGYGLKDVYKKHPKVKNIAIIIGPEGGFSSKEIDFLEELGSEIVTLGKRILRTETAGFVSLSFIQFIYGDMGGII